MRRRSHFVIITNPKGLGGPGPASKRRTVTSALKTESIDFPTNTRPTRIFTPTFAIISFVHKNPDPENSFFLSKIGFGFY